MCHFWHYRTYIVIWNQRFLLYMSVLRSPLDSNGKAIFQWHIGHFKFTIKLLLGRRNAYVHFMEIGLFTSKKQILPASANLAYVHVLMEKWSLGHFTTKFKAVQSNPKCNIFNNQEQLCTTTMLYRDTQIKRHAGRFHTLCLSEL